MSRLISMADRPETTFLPGSLTDPKSPTSRDSSLRCQLTFVHYVPSKASSGASDLPRASADRTLQARDRCVRLPESGKEPAHQHGILFGRPEGPNRAERLEPDPSGALECAPRGCAAQIHALFRCLGGRARIVGACGEVVLGRSVTESGVRDRSHEHGQGDGSDPEPAPARARRSQAALDQSGGQGLGRVFVVGAKVTGRSGLGGAGLIRAQGWRHDRVVGPLVRLDLKRGPSDPDLVTRTHRHGSSDPFPVDEGAVGRIEVFDDHRFTRAA